jgi:hypothetical protein
LREIALYSIRRRRFPVGARLRARSCVRYTSRFSEVRARPAVWRPIFVPHRNNELREAVTLEQQRCA